MTTAPLHRFVLRIEDGHTSWSIVCPDGGEACGPGHACAACGRGFDDKETTPCYDCPPVEEQGLEGCWVQSWVGTAMAEEVLRGTLELVFPVRCEFNGDGLEAHIAGTAIDPRTVASRALHLYRELLYDEGARVLLDESDEAALRERAVTLAVEVETARAANGGWLPGGKYDEEAGW